jgi:hypothetical protein
MQVRIHAAGLLGASASAVAMMVRGLRLVPYGPYVHRDTAINSGSARHSHRTRRFPLRPTFTVSRSRSSVPGTRQLARALGAPDTRPVSGALSRGYPGHRSTRRPVPAGLERNEA